MQLWFQEDHDGAMRVAYKIRSILYQGRSPFQSIQVLESENFGKMMIIDDMVMVTEADEFVYHELISHVPILLHKNPKRVLVIGGGDGGAVRELLRHDSLEEVVICELDELVLEKAKEFLPSLSSGFYDPRTTINIGDGVVYLRNMESASFDIIIVDSTDPVGPGEVLFSKNFYGDVARCLKPGGLMVCQSESAWYHRDTHQLIHGNLSSNFSHLKPYMGFVPSYPQGLWTWTLAANHPIDVHACSWERFDKVKTELKYLNEDIYRSCFALPNFYLKKLIRNKY